jgi:hypothetical protein
MVEYPPFPNAGHYRSITRFNILFWSEYVQSGPCEFTQSYPFTGDVYTAGDGFEYGC